MNSKFSKLTLMLFCILIVASNVAGALFTVDQPDGTGDNTSAYYTISWSPPFKGMTKADGNTISCYAEGTNTAYATNHQLVTGYACCDTNDARVYVGALGGRGISAQYYVWCINDFNSDMNDYSPGQFTLSRFEPLDFAGMAFDTAGGFLVGIATNAYAIGSLIVVLIVVVLMLDLITGVFGIFDAIRGLR